MDSAETGDGMLAMPAVMLNPAFAPGGPKPPQRCFVLTVKIGGDTWGDVASELARISEHVLDHGQECQLVSGGCSSGAIVTVDHNPSMTRDKYFEAIEEMKAMGS